MTTHWGWVIMKDSINLTGRLHLLDSVACIQAWHPHQQELRQKIWNFCTWIGQVQCHLLIVQDLLVTRRQIMYSCRREEEKRDRHRYFLSILCLFHHLIHVREDKDRDRSSLPTSLSLCVFLTSLLSSHLILLEPFSKFFLFSLALLLNQISDVIFLLPEARPVQLCVKCECIIPPLSINSMKTRRIKRKEVLSVSGQG